MKRLLTKAERQFLKTWLKVYGEEDVFDTQIEIVRKTYYGTRSVVRHLNAMHDLGIVVKHIYEGQATRHWYTYHSPPINTNKKLSVES